MLKELSIMTTIAWDGKILASDTLSTSGNMKLPGIVTKIKRIGKYRIAFTGESAPAFSFFERYIQQSMIIGDLEYNTVTKSEDDFGLIVIEDDSKYCKVFNSITGHWDEFSPPISLGSGSKYAIGSMYSGYDAIKAVEIACQLDTHSGLPVDSLM